MSAFDEVDSDLSHDSGDNDREVESSEFTNHWSKLADMLTSSAAVEALNTHVEKSCTSAAPTPREAEEVEIVEELAAKAEEEDVAPASTAPVSKKEVRSNKDFGKHEYWEGRFEEEEEYEWLLKFDQVKEQVLPLLHPYSKEASILLVGVGNSSFSADLYDAGYKNLTNLDYSAVVIERMQSKHSQSRPEMKVSE
mgnify:FL=1|jgi:hypothetical protein